MSTFLTEETQPAPRAHHPPLSRSSPVLPSLVPPASLMPCCSLASLADLWSTRHILFRAHSSSHSRSSTHGCAHLYSSFPRTFSAPELSASCPSQLCLHVSVHRPGDGAKTRIPGQWWRASICRVPHWSRHQEPCPGSQAKAWHFPAIMHSGSLPTAQRLYRPAISVAKLQQDISVRQSLFGKLGLLNGSVVSGEDFCWFSF